MNRTNPEGRRKLAFIATGPHRFPGAGQIMSQWLIELAKRDHDVTYIGPDEPFLYRFVSPCGVQVKKTTPIVSSFYDSSSGGPIEPEKRSQDLIYLLNLCEQLVNFATEKDANGSSVVLWGTYLFPTGYAAYLAARILKHNGVDVALWITPAGSDIWEIGPQLRNTVSSMLCDPIIDRIITYTTQFASEIEDRYQLKRTIDTIYPSIDFNRFATQTAFEKKRARMMLGVSENCFVISSHSNMRPVKYPEGVLRFAEIIARESSKNVTLLMIGPKRELTPTDGRLNLIWTGVVENIEKYIYAADVELNCSLHDSFNLSLAESMACGIPCVSSDVVGIGPEIIRSGSGVLFPSKDQNISNPDYQAAINFVLRVVHDPVYHSFLCKKAAAHARTVFQGAEAARLLECWAVDKRFSGKV